MTIYSSVRLPDPCHCQCMLIFGNLCRSRSDFKVDCPSCSIAAEHMLARPEPVVRRVLDTGSMDAWQCPRFVPRDCKQPVVEDTKTWQDLGCPALEAVFSDHPLSAKPI